jgi:hypothetical protein
VDGGDESVGVGNFTLGLVDSLVWCAGQDGGEFLLSGGANLRKVQLALLCYALLYFVLQWIGGEPTTIHHLL